MYNPLLGQWLSRDPLGLAAGDNNLYRYCLGNPTNHTDPSGREVRIYKRRVVDDSQVNWIGVFFGLAAGCGGTAAYASTAFYHATVVWFDPKTGAYVMYDGGGSTTSGRGGHPAKTRHPKTDVNGPHYLQSGQTIDEMYASRFDNKPSSLVQVIKGESVEREYKDLEDAFNKLQQVPYRPKGPNSNTFASQLLYLAGFGRIPKPEGAVGWDYQGPGGYNSTEYDKYGRPRGK